MCASGAGSAYGGGELYYGIPEPSSERILEMLEDVKPADAAVPMATVALAPKVALALTMPKAKT